MLITRITLGRREEVTHPDAVRAALAELISTFIFTFAAQGSAITSEKLADGAPSLAGLLVASLSHAFALFAAVSVSANISGGHVNPAVTLGAFIGGNLSLVRVLLYWLAQLLGSTFACLFLKLMTGLDVASFLASNGVGSGTAMVFELVMTFGLVYTVYATSFDPRKGAIGAVAPVAIGLVVGANILAGGAFTGAAMNPALAFGPALVGWRWADQWVYWLGPLLGAAAASFVYLFFIMSPPQVHDHEHIGVAPDY